MLVNTFTANDEQWEIEFFFSNVIRIPIGHL